MVILRFLVGLLAVISVFLLVATDVLAKESSIEEVHAAQLEKLLAKKDFVAVFWYARHCHVCEETLEELEGIDEDAEQFSVHFVKINDKRLAKSYGIKRFPALTFFRDGELTVFEGDLTDEDEVLEFLTSENLLIIPGKIEDVNAEALSKIIKEQKYVTALFYDQNRELDIMIKNVDHLLVLFHDKKKASQQALEALENIDDDADKLGVSFVEVSDVGVGRHHGVYSYPTLVYFENEIPAVYDKSLSDHDEALKWLVQMVEGADIERVKAEMLEKIITKDDKVAILLYKDNDSESDRILEALEDIDDDLDEKGVRFLKNNELEVLEEYGIQRVPSLVLFKKGIPSIFEGNLEDEDLVLEWILEEISGDNRVEIVTNAMLDKLIKKRKHVAVFFYTKGNAKSLKALQALEEIDDDIKNHPDMHLVKLDDQAGSKEYGIDRLPTLLFFDEGIPGIFRGNLENASDILDWLNHAVLVDNIGEVNTVILSRIVNEFQNILVFVYYQSDAHDLEILTNLENIDHDLESLDVQLVRLPDDGSFAQKHRLDVIPALVLFQDGKPEVFKGDMGTEHKLFAQAFVTSHHRPISFEKGSQNRLSLTSMKSLVWTLLLVSLGPVSRTQEIDENGQDQGTSVTSTTEPPTSSSIIPPIETNSNETSTPANFTRPETCLKPVNPGRHKGYFQRYFFNSTEGSCSEFINGDAGHGNGNNFDSLEECEGICLGKPFNRTDEGPSGVETEGERDQHYEIDVSVRVVGYEQDKIGSMGNENPFLMIQLVKLNGSKSEANLTIFDLDAYGSAFSGNEDWNTIKFTLMKGLKGNFTLQFVARRGTSNESDLQIEEVKYRWIPTFKTIAEEQKIEEGNNSTVTETPSTNATTSNETTTESNNTSTESTINNSTSTETSSTNATSTESSNTTTEESVGGNATTAGLGSESEDKSAGSHATVVILAVFVVVLVGSLLGLGIKHYQLIQSVNGAYTVSSMPTQSYDNPSYSGHHTPADRFGGH
eukprot:maker-scaffold561_size136864-snap-gene-0.22 protein:Tk09527 transcript:maker-scaffold561_size136864-snap-gene-0.22-mRNA-1 annotation:"GL10978"